MSMKPSTMQALFSLLLFTLFVIPLAQAKHSLKQPGECEPLSNKGLIDNRVRQIADFAVSEHNSKAGTHFKFLDIFEGCVQIVEGKNYFLTLGAINGKRLQYCEAVVYENFNFELTPISFELLPKPENGLELLPIDESLVKLAKFAIDEINKRINKPFEEHKFVFEKLYAALYPEGLYGGDFLLYIIARLPHSGINPYYFRARVNDDGEHPVLVSYDDLSYVPNSANKFIGLVTDAFVTV